MNTPFDNTTATALLLEADTRMTQALENFFQRSRTSIQDAMVRANVEQPPRPPGRRGMLPGLA